MNEICENVQLTSGKIKDNHSYDYYFDASKNCKNISIALDGIKWRKCFICVGHIILIKLIKEIPAVTHAKSQKLLNKMWEES